MAIGLSLWWGVDTDSHHPARGQQGPGLVPFGDEPFSEGGRDRTWEGAAVRYQKSRSELVQSLAECTGEASV